MNPDLQRPMPTEAPPLPEALHQTTRIARDRGLAFDARAELKESRTVSRSAGGSNSIGEDRTLGVCVRVWIDGVSGFASSHDLDSDAIEEMVDTAVRIARNNARRPQATFPYVDLGGGSFSYEADVEVDPFEGQVSEIVDLLERCQQGAQAEEGETRSRASFDAERRHVLYEDASGRTGDCTFVLSTLATLSVKRGSDRSGSGVSSLGGERGLGELAEGDTPEEIGAQAARDAEESLRAVPAPSGRQRVLCDNHLAGVLAHESFGHLIEADVVEMGWSLLSGREGERFADEAVSVVDTPGPPRGSRNGVQVPYDQEGVEGREVRVLDEGVLKSFLHLRGSASEKGLEPTGNGRAYSPRYPPIARMRNTFFEPGEMTREEALEALGDGVYLVGTKGGAPSSHGTFMFTSKKGYRVEDGEIREPIRSTSISGHILDFLDNVEGVTQDFGMSTTTFGGCGKWGQSFLPIGIGGPHLLVDGALIGGKAR